MVFGGKEQIWGNFPPSPRFCVCYLNSDLADLAARLAVGPRLRLRLSV